MNSSPKVILAAALGFLICQMYGCASTDLVDIWHDSSFQAPPLGKMLVVAVSKDATKRRIWEDAFAYQLAQQGVAATSSYRLFSDALPDTNQVVATVQENGSTAFCYFQTPDETNTQYIQGIQPQNTTGVTAITGKNI